MFSLRMLNEKASDNKSCTRASKKKTEKPLMPPGSFIPLGNGTIESDSKIPKIKKPNSKKKVGALWRFYNKLSNEEVKEISSPICNSNLNNQLTCTQNVGNCSLELHKTMDTILRKERDTKKKIKQKAEKIKAKALAAKEAPPKKKKKKKSKLTAVEKFGVSAKKLGSSKLRKKKKRARSIPYVATPDVEMEDLNENNNNTLSEDITVPISSKYIDLVGNKDEDLYPFDTKENKLYLSYKPLDENGSLLVALFPSTKIYICGSYSLKLLIGSISVMGYKFSPLEEQIIYSFPCHSILSIDIHDGVEVKSMHKQALQELGIPFEWGQNFNTSKEQLVSIVKLKRHESNMTNIINKTETIQAFKFESCNLDMFKEVVGVNLLEDPESTQLGLLKTPPEWTDYLLKMQHVRDIHERLVIVVAGGQGLGKSTLVKFLLNGLINDDSVEEVACLDLDVGQPEFSVPSSLSLSRFTSPLLGPNFTHRDKMSFKYYKEVLLGDISVQHMMKEYLEIVAFLASECNTFNTSVPVVVNTMGFTSGPGLDIMVDVLRIIQPTHVITIESRNKNRNYAFPLNAEQVSSTNRGVITSSYVTLNYESMIFRTYSKARGLLASKFLRDLNVLSYLSKCWNPNETNIIGDTCKPTVNIDWRNIAIHVQGSFIPQMHILQAINASYVALCKINEDYLETVDSYLPLKIQDGRSWVNSSICLGWGVVRGINPATRTIHLLTPLDPSEFLEINVIALSKVHLPLHFQNYFSIGDAPYWQRSIN